MTTTVLTPNAVTYTTPGTGPSGESITGFNGTVAVAVSAAYLTDANDSTRLDMNTSAAFPGTQKFGLTSATLGTGVAKSWFATVRATGSVVSGPMVLAVALYTPEGVQLGQTYLALPGTMTTMTTTPMVLPANLTQAQIDGLELLFYFNPNALNGANIAEASVSLTVAAIPVANITYPTGTPALGASSMTATWSHTPGADGGAQSYYQVKVFTAAQYGAGGFNPTTSTAHYDSGVVTSSAPSAVVGPLDNSTTFRVYVRTAQTVNAVAQWSAWDFEGFTTAYTPSTVQTVTAAAGTTAGVQDSLILTIARNTGTAAWASIELERFDADGVWRPVRGSTHVTAVNNFTTAWAANTIVVRDWESPNGGAVTYRARATTATGTVGAWTSSSSVSWLTWNRATWLKDPLVPSRNRLVEVQEFPSSARSLTQGIFDIIGAKFPVVVSDVRNARVGAFMLQTATMDEGVRLDAALEASPFKLLQFPATHSWGSKYIAVSDYQELHFDASTDVFIRAWQVGYVEIDRPADDTAY